MAIWHWALTYASWAAFVRVADGRLEPWAQALWRDFRIITEPRRLRQILNCLRSLLSMLENRLEDLEAQEATRGT